MFACRTTSTAGGAPTQRRCPPEPTGKLLAPSLFAPCCVRSVCSEFQHYRLLSTNQSTRPKRAPPASDPTRNNDKRKLHGGRCSHASRCSSQRAPTLNIRKNGMPKSTTPFIKMCRQKSGRLICCHLSKSASRQIRIQNSPNAECSRARPKATGKVASTRRLQRRHHVPDATFQHTIRQAAGPRA